MRVCSSPTVIGTGRGPGLRLGGFLVVRGIGGNGGGLVSSDPLLAPPGIGLPPSIAHLSIIAVLDLPPGRP